MQKILSFIKKYKVEILSFLTPMVIFGLCCLLGGLFPFGDELLPAYDGIAQYPGFSTYFSNVLKGTDSLLYSFKGGLGYNFYATFIYYLSNPTSLLSIFFNNNTIIYFYTLIIFLRIGLSGFTMSKLLKYKNKNGKLITIFSIAYALMAYNVLYFYNYMYFDTIVLFPIVIIGLEKLIHERKPLMYLITLSISILSNFYIGYMVCIFCLLYFIYSYIIMDKEKRNKKIIFDFIKYSICSALISGIFLIPVIYEILAGKITAFENNTYTVYWAFNDKFYNIFYRLSIGSYKSADMAKSYPNIYTSLFVFFLSVVFFFNKNISKKEKICTLVFLLFYWLCFSFNFLDYAWHMFQRPIWYPKRYSFTFSLLLILIAYKSFNNISKVKLTSSQILIVILSMILAITLSGLFSVLSIDQSVLIFLVLSSICLIEYSLIYKATKFTFFIIAVFLLEVSINTFIGLKNIGFTRTNSSYIESMEKYEYSMESVEKLEEKDNNFYRLEFSEPFNSNNGAHFDYNGIKYFSSLRNQKAITLLELLDQRVVDGCSVAFYTENPLINSIFGIKYLSGSKNELSYTKLTDKDPYMYKNEDALSLGFMVNENILDAELENNISHNMELIVDSMLGKKTNMIKRMQYTSYENLKFTQLNTLDYIRLVDEKKSFMTLNYEGTASYDMYIVLPKKFRKFYSVNVTIGDYMIQGYNSSNKFAIEIKKGQTYKISLKINATEQYLNDIIPIEINKEIYDEFIKEMKSNQMEITYYKKDNYIKGKVTSTKDKNILFTSIPYDEGWTIKVNGEKIKYDKSLDSLISIKLNEGTYEIEFSYVPKGLYYGCISSIIGITLSIIFLKRKRVK